MNIAGQDLRGKPKVVTGTKYVVFSFFILRWTGGKEAQKAHHTSTTYFHTCVDCTRNPALASVSFTSRGSDKRELPFPAVPAATPADQTRLVKRWKICVHRGVLITMVLQKTRLVKRWKICVHRGVLITMVLRKYKPGWWVIGTDRY